MNNKTKNPWLEIPCEDYEGHMSAPNVAQLQMLDEMFEMVLDEFSPRSICIPGCTAGNGFQHLVNRDLDLAVGIDINAKYLIECRNWFIQDVRNLQLICADLNDFDLIKPMFDLIHVALVFEYVEIDLFLSKIFRWLKPNGILSIILQMSSESIAAVSETDYQSIKTLTPFIKIVSPIQFKKAAQECGFLHINETEFEPTTGKHFFKACFKK